MSKAEPVHAIHGEHYCWPQDEMEEFDGVVCWNECNIFYEIKAKHQRTGTYLVGIVEHPNIENTPPAVQQTIYSPFTIHCVSWPEHRNLQNLKCINQYQILTSNKWECNLLMPVVRTDSEVQTNSLSIRYHHRRWSVRELIILDILESIDVGGILIVNTGHLAVFCLPPNLTTVIMQWWHVPHAAICAITFVIQICFFFCLFV